RWDVSGARRALGLAGAGCEEVARRVPGHTGLRRGAATYRIAVARRGRRRSRHQLTLDPHHDYQLAFDLDEPDDEAAIAARRAAAVGVAPDGLPPLEVRKRSIDARRGRVRFQLSVGISAGPARLGGAPLRDTAGPPVVIVGAGPAGMFCAYELARAGVR